MTTKREDAESIVEDEEVIKGLDLKSQAEDELLVVKSEDADEDEMDGKKKKKEDMKEECSTVEENTVVTPELSPIEKSLAALQARVAELKAQGVSGENALNAIQKDFDAVGNVIKAEFTPPPSPEEVARQSLETTLRSLLEEMLPQALGQAVAPIQADLETLKGELRAKSLTTPTRTEKIETVQRSLPATVARQKIEQQSMSQFDLLARQTVGGLQ